MYSSTCFGRLHAYHQELTTALTASDFTLERGGSSAVGRGLAGHNRSVHHHTIQINQPTRCNSSSSLLLDAYVQLNMFRASSHPSSGAQQLAVAASGFTAGAW